MSSRAGGGWQSEDLTPFANISDNELFAGSSDGTKALIGTSASLLSADQDNPTDEAGAVGAFDFYIVSASEGPRLVSAGSLPRTIPAEERQVFGASGAILPSGSLVAFNAELSAVGFYSSAPLDLNAQGEVLGKTSSRSVGDCYDWVNVGPSPRAELTNPDPSGSDNCELLTMTPDGRAIFRDISGDSSTGKLLVYGDQAEAFPDLGELPAVVISAPNGTETLFDGLSPDGKTAYVTTAYHLKSNADSGAEVYGVEIPQLPRTFSETPPEQNVTCLSCGFNAGSATFVGQSTDGSHVFVETPEDLWSWSRSKGAVELAPAADGLEHLVFSHDGRYAIATTSVALSPSDTDGLSDVYLLSAGAPPRLITSGTATALYTPVAVSDSGQRIVYDVGEALHEDGEEGQGVVINEWSAGHSAQVSPLGSSYAYSVVGTAGPELEDIVFEAHEPLVPADQNAGTTDVYDARIDGGFPAPSEPVSEHQTANPVAPSASPYSDGLTPESTQPAELSVDTSHPTSTFVPKSLTRAQKLARALKACKKQPRTKRRACETGARKKYGTKLKARKTAKKTGKAGK